MTAPTPAQMHEVADREPHDPLTDPANAKVLAALRVAADAPGAPPNDQDKVIAMLRERGLWKPEYDA